MRIYSSTVTGSAIFSGSIYWPITESIVGGNNNVLIWDPATSKIKTTGSYGVGGGGTPGGQNGHMQYNNNGAFGGNERFSYNGSSTWRLTGSLLISNIAEIGTTIIGGTFNISSSTSITSSLTVSGSTNLIGTTNVTGSLIVSSSSRIIGTETITGSLIVSSSSNVIGTSRVTGSLIVSNSFSVIGTGSISGSLSVSSSVIGQTALQIIGTGSATTSPIVQIAGQTGGFVQIYDSNSGSLFSVNNNTGTAIVDVRSNGQTLIGSNTFQGTYDSVGIASFSGPTQSLLIPGYFTSSFNMLVMDYVAISGSYGKTGTLTGIMSGSIVDSAAPAARTFGTTPPNNMNFEVSMSGQYYTIIARSDTNGWFVKGIVRGI